MKRIISAVSVPLLILTAGFTAAAQTASAEAYEGMDLETFRANVEACMEILVGTMPSRELQEELTKEDGVQTYTVAESDIVINAETFPGSDVIKMAGITIDPDAESKFLTSSLAVYLSSMFAMSLPALRVYQLQDALEAMEDQNTGELDSIYGAYQQPTFTLYMFAFNTGDISFCFTHNASGQDKVDAEL